MTVPSSLSAAPGSGERGAYYRWLFFGAGPVESAVSNKAMGFQIPPERAGASGYGSLDSVLNTLEGAVSRGDYLAGDRFTAADLYVGAQLGWGMQFGTIEKRPAFERYVGRIIHRPAAIRAREIDDALLPKK